MTTEQQEGTGSEECLDYSEDWAVAYLLRLSVFPASFTAAQAAHICRETQPAEYLTAMHSRGMLAVEAAESGPRYVLPEDSREIYRGLLSPNSRRRLALRFALLCASEAEDYLRLLRVAQGWSAALRAQVERERDNWQAALDWLLDQGRYNELAARLLCAAGPLWGAWSDTRQTREWYERMMREPSALPLQTWHILCLNTGQMALDAGEYRQAQRWFRTASEWARATRIAANEGEALELLGIALHHGEQDAAAQKAFHQARRLYRKTGSRVGEARTLDALGDAYLVQGRTRAAKFCFAASLRLWRGEQNELETAGALFHFAEAQHRLGNAASARFALCRSLRLREQWGEQVGVGDCLLLLGTLAAEGGDAERGQEQIERAMQLYESTGRRESRAAALSAMSRALLAQGRAGQAERCAVEGLRFWQDKGHSHWTGVFLLRRAEIACERGAMSDAEQFCREALQSCAERDGSLVCGEAHFILGRAAELRGVLTDALSEYQCALKRYEKMAYRRGMEAAVSSLKRLQTPPSETIREEHGVHAVVSLRQAWGWRGLLQMPSWGRG